MTHPNQHTNLSVASRISRHDHRQQLDLKQLYMNTHNHTLPGDPEEPIYGAWVQLWPISSLWYVCCGNQEVLNMQWCHLPATVIFHTRGLTMGLDHADSQSTTREKKHPNFFKHWNNWVRYSRIQPNQSLKGWKHLYTHFTNSFTLTHT